MTAGLSAEAPALAARCAGLVKRYPDVVAVDGLELEVRRGECFGLLGPNGAGKTTTVEILEGLTPPTAGVVEVLGERWGRGAGADRALRRRLGVSLQQTDFPEKLTVEEVLALFRSLYRDDASPGDARRGLRSVDELIALVELEEKRRSRVGKLSGGQKQRLSFACALVGAPELLFLDEPTTGLDPQARLKVWELVERFRAGGGTVLLTTHYMDEAARLCDRVAVVDHGKVIALGTPAELIRALGADQIVELRLGAEVPVAPLGQLPGVRAVRRRDAVTVFEVTEIGVMLPALLATLAATGVELESLTTHQATLEDVFVHLTGRGLRDA